MKKVNFDALLAIVIMFTSCCIGIIFGVTVRYTEVNGLYEKLNAYRTYYDGAEELLDTLANDNNWPDRFDVQAYYDGLYELDKVGE